MKEHRYDATVRWTGDLGTGTSDYKAYSRDHQISFPGKAVLPGSSDPAFRGDIARYNPEELLVASLSACHMLWYLHLCAVNNVVLKGYEDDAYGIMTEDREGPGRFVKVVLRPRAVISKNSDSQKAIDLHHEAHRHCFIANSVNFPVTIEPAVSFEQAS